MGIVYSGRFDVGPIGTRFAAWVLRTADGRVTEGRTIRCDGVTESTALEWRWRHLAFDLELHVAPRTSPHEVMLHESKTGIIRWRCDALAANVAMRLGETRLDGLGYSETLEMTVPPWSVPMRTLRWGRFIADSDAMTSMAWIDWRGGTPLTAIVSEQGVERCGAVDDRSITTAQGRLELEDVALIREGVLGGGPLARIPILSFLIPFGVRRLLAADERKSLARATLLGGDRVARGWAVHEVVEFGEPVSSARSTSPGGAA